jgi:hypothetical protein
MSGSNTLRTHLDRLQWLFLSLLTLPALWPLLANGLPARADRALHLMRLAYLDQSIRQGVIFPRWLPEMMLGRGYPTFNFYGSGVYYLTEFFHLLGLNLFDASVATLILLVLLAGFGMYILARDLFGPQAMWASLVAAIAYLYAPYFLTASIYQRGATAEAMAEALMPWVLWSVRRLFNGQTPALWATILALLLATLVFSHTLMLLIFPPLLAGYVLIQWLQNGRRGPLLGWALVGLVGAIGISAFFWLPLVVERDYLSKTAYDIARGAFLPNGTLTWETFVAEGWFYTYVRPPRLGLVQFLLAAIGALVMLMRRRTWENSYWLFSAVVAGALVGSWARPLWENSEILLSIQYPWRVLTLLTLILAIFTGALVAYWPFQRLHGVVAILLTGVIIYANLPRIADMPYYSRTDTELPPQMLAQLEYEEGVETGGEGSSFVQEFRPLWASRNLLYTTPPNLSAPPLTLEPAQGNAYTTVLNVTSNITATASVPLRFNEFYFPGWQVRMEDGAGNGTILPTYPTTNVGLLTVDVPPGAHQLTLTWTGTTVQRIAGTISMFTLALLAGFSWWQGRRRIAIIPCVLLVVALAATYSHPTLAKIEAPAQPLEADGVRLLGIRTDYEQGQNAPTHIYLHPYWYVLSGGPNPNLQAHWQLQDEAGAVRSEIVSGPHYNASTPRTWPPGTLVEDAYMLPLPPGLPAGRYAIVLQLEADGSTSQPVHVGTLTLASPTPPQEVEMIATNALFGDEIRLAGFATSIHPQLVTTETAPPVNAGEDVLYRLYWQAVKTPTANYHSYIHLLDSAGNAIYKSDQLPGPWFRPPKGWDTYYLQEDTHRLEIPANTPGGLYWPTVGLYELRQMHRMGVTEDGRPVDGDVFRLPPIKVVGAPAEPPIKRVARFDDGFQLLGYGLALPEGGLYPGSTFEVTLYYRSEAQPAKDYTRFFHLYNPEFGLAAQADSTPQAGANPTGSWVPGETVIDTMTLQVAETATPADYRLFTGFYDPNAGGVRLGVQDEAGQPLPDSGVVLQTVTVQAQPQ